MPETDMELVRRCLEGNNSAFAGILELFQDRIYSFALRLLKDPVAAEEAAQEAFVKAFRGLSSYSSAYAFSPWLFRARELIKIKLAALKSGNATVQGL